MSDYKKKRPGKFPQECPCEPEKYTEEIVAIDHIELGGPPEPEEFLTDREARIMEIRQNSSYQKGNLAAPDNNIFFEERSNPLSSKGN